MNVWAIVPVKPFAEGKSRLAGYVSPQERHTLNRDLLTRTLRAIRLAHVTAGTVVVSRDRGALAMAEQAGIYALAEDLIAETPLPPMYGSDGGPAHAPWASARSRVETGPELQLNAALTQAASYVVARGASAVLILPTDMPTLTVQDVQAMASPRGREPQIIIAPSRDGGTNALFLQPAQAIPFAFGRGSFRRHQRLAEEADIPVRVVESASLAFDVDLPEDYDRASDPQAER